MTDKTIRTEESTRKLWVKDPEDIKLFIGGVPSSLTDHEIITHFSGCGALKSFKRMLTKEKQHSGCAFLEIKTYFKDQLISKPHRIRTFLLHCQLADSLHGVAIRKAEEMQRKIFVSNLPSFTSDINFLQIFSPLAKVEKAFVVRRKSDGGAKNFGFVIFSSREEMEMLLAKHQPILYRGRKLNLRQATARETKPTSHPKESHPGNSVPDNTNCSDVTSVPSPMRQMLSSTPLLNSSDDNYRFNFSLTCPNHTL